MRVQTSARGAREKCGFKRCRFKSGDILVGVLGIGWVGHQSKRGSQGFGKLSTHLNAWAAAATPMSVPSSSLGRRQRAASFLSSLGGNCRDENWELLCNLNLSWITSNTSTKSIFRFPSWVGAIVNLKLIWESTLKKVVGSSVPLSMVRGAWSSSEDCWGTSCWRGRNLCLLCLSLGIFLFHPQSPPLCLFYGVYVPSWRVRCHIRHSQQWESETEIRWDFSIIWIFKSTLTKIRKHEKVFDSCFRANNSIRRILIVVDKQKPKGEKN